MRIPVILAFECGSDYLSGGVWAQSETGKLECRQHAKEPLSAAATSDEAWVQAIGEALKRMLARLDCGQSDCVLTVPGHLTLTKFVKTPAVERSKRDRIVQFEATQNIPYPLNEVAWGYAEVADDGVEVELMLSAVKRGILDDLCAVFENAGLSVVGIEPDCLAAVRAWVNSPGRTKGCTLVVDVSARSTQLLFVGIGSFFVRTLPFGGNLVARSPQESPDDSGEETAEGTSARRDFIKRLRAELTRSILSYSRHTDAESPEEVILCDASSGLPDLPERLTETLALPVRRWDSVQDSFFDDTNAGDDSGMVLEGLVRGHFEKNGVGINLLPPERLHEKRERRVRPWWLAAAALVVLAMLPLIAYLQMAGAQRERLNRNLLHEMEPLIQWDIRNRQNLERLQALRERVEALREIQARRGSWSLLLADLQSQLGEVGDVWLERLEVLPISPLSSESVSESPLRLAVSGKLLDAENPTAKASEASYDRVKHLLERFSRSAYIREVTNERFDNSQPGILKFEITLVIDEKEAL